MLFLGLGEWLSGVASSAAGAALKIARTFFFALDTFIYELIINLYNLFETLCTARMLDNSLMKEISDRVGLILGLIMFFYIVFEFVKMMIDPDTLEDKQKGAAAIVKRTLMVIVMLGVSTFAFNSLYTIQRTVIKSNVISKLILPYSIETDKFGAVLSEELMYAFYQMEPVDESTITDADELDVYQSCEGMVTAFRNQIIKSNRFDLGYTCLNEQITVEMDSGGTESQEIFVINFNWLLSPIAGIAVVYFLLMYCISIGVRMIQLTVLEVISPMAIVAYLSPKQDNTFTKWSKIYVSTYIDVFIRIAIINFVIFLIATIFDSSSDGGFIFWESVGNPTGKAYWFFLVVIIIALLAFAKKAPDLIKQLLPEGASKLGFGGWKLSDLAGGKQIAGIAKKGTGTLIGAGAGLVGGAIGGGFAGAALGLLRGGAKGFSSKGFVSAGTGGYANARDKALKARQRKQEGGNINPFARIGAQRRVNDADIAKAKKEEQTKILSQITSNFKAVKDIIKGKLDDGSYNQNEHMQAYHKHKNRAQELRDQLSRIDESISNEEVRNKTIAQLKAKGINIEKAGGEKYLEVAMKATRNQLGQAKRDAMNLEITKQESAATDAYDKAMESYYNEKMSGPNADAVLQNIVKTTNDIIANNQDIDAIKGQTTNNFAAFKGADGAANGAITDINIEIANIERKSKKDKINVKYK